MKKYLYLALLMACQPAVAIDIPPVSQQTVPLGRLQVSEVIEGSYIVTMKPDEPETISLFNTVQKKSRQIGQPANIKKDFSSMAMAMPIT